VPAAVVSWPGELGIALGRPECGPASLGLPVADPVRVRRSREFLGRPLFLQRRHSSLAASFGVHVRIGTELELGHEERAISAVHTDALYPISYPFLFFA